MAGESKRRSAHPPDHRNRLRILEDLDSTMLVEAAAGTGKTTSMIGRMVSLIREGKCRIDTMAAITFTRKAAAELRSRFQIELERSAGEASGEAGKRLDQAVSHIERCFIGTVHSFCGRLIRERPIEAGVDLAFQEMEDNEDFSLREAAWDEYVAGLYTSDSLILDEFHRLGLEIDHLRAYFMRFADFPDVQRWPVGRVEPIDTRDARERLLEYVHHMEDLIPSFPPDYGTDKLMPTYGRIVRMARNRDLSRDADLMTVLEELEGNPGVTQKCWPGGKAQALHEKALWEGFAGEVAGPLLRRWREMRYGFVIRVFREAIRRYDEHRGRTRRLNFQDLLMNAAGLLRDKPQIRRYFRSRFTHILVDEFQDTDPIQAQVMMYLTASDTEETEWRKCTPVPGSLFVVGDPKQSIYRFRRADIVTYNQVKEIIEASGGCVIPLTANFRTVEGLVGWNNRIFADTFPAAATAYSPAFHSMEVGREEGAGGELSGVRVIEVPPEYGKKEEVVAYEADFIARTIRRALDEGMTVPRSRRDLEYGKGPVVTPGDFMIITRRKAELAIYARKLEELGIPHETSGGSALKQVTEAKLLIDCLRAVTEPENPVSLVAVLRGGLFGLSDRQLYKYRRAGGEFSYRSKHPDGLDGESERLFEEIFGRLARYDRWLKRMPPVPAVERIAGDLGLMVRALCRPGGSVMAGSMVKLFQMLRAASASIHSVSDLTRYMVELIENNVEFDGVPVRPHGTSVVRLMNLHKVKGLEAPIVFLANPTGKWNPSVGLHIDRSGESIDGYMAVSRDRGLHNKQMLAIPPGWDGFEEEEKRFRKAEEDRLLYVAATRAGSMLVITQRAKGNKSNWWNVFRPYLDDAEPLPDPGSQTAPAGSRITITRENIDRAAALIAGAWKPVMRPTYARAAVKELSVSPQGQAAESTGWITSGEHGTEWGTVIHTLLESAMRGPGADLSQVARAAVEEQDLDASYVSRALRAVESIMKSKIWRRAVSSGRHLVEVPVTVCRSAEADGAGGYQPLIIRGAIDLVFRENGGWVIVDYKTDGVPAEALQTLVDHYRGQVLIYRDVWEEATGEQVKEAGLYFTHPDEYVIVG